LCILEEETDWKRGARGKKGSGRTMSDPIGTSMDTSNGYCLRVQRVGVLGACACDSFSLSFYSSFKANNLVERDILGARAEGGMDIVSLPVMIHSSIRRKAQSLDDDSDSDSEQQSAEVSDGNGSEKKGFGEVSQLYNNTGIFTKRRSGGGNPEFQELDKSCLDSAVEQTGNESASSEESTEDRTQPTVRAASFPFSTLA
jgi:hypothetical protein